MAAGKEIRGKIKSVENTKKITKAMEMVAASKMRKAQDRMRAARPYADKIRNITANLALANPEYQSPYMRKGGNSKVTGMIVVTTDKGLCGGLNTNVLRAVTNELRDVQAAAAAEAAAVAARHYSSADALTRFVRRGAHAGDRSLCRRSRAHGAAAGRPAHAGRAAGDGG